MEITEDAQATVHQESSEAVSALLASQNAESTSPYLPLNLSPVSSPLIPQAPSPSEGGPRPDVEPPAQQQVIAGVAVATAASISKMEFASPEVIRCVDNCIHLDYPIHLQHVQQEKFLIFRLIQFLTDVINLTLRRFCSSFFHQCLCKMTECSERVEMIFSFLFYFRPLPSDNVNAVPVLPHFLQYQHKHPHYTSIHNSIKSQSLAGEVKKWQHLPQMATFLSSDDANTKSILSPSPNTALPEPPKLKLQHTSNSQFHAYPSPKTADLKSKPHSGQLDSLKPKPNTSPEVSKHKIPKGSDVSSPPTSRSLAKADPAKAVRSCFRSSSPQSESSSTRSPLIIDRNETFTIYRDPALVSSNSENSLSATISSGHIASYLHPHLLSLHPPSPHSPCLAPVSHPHAASHLLTSPHTAALPHPHLLPPGVLPAMPPTAASILGGHPRLDSPSGLGHITLPHPASAHQQQFLPVRFTLPNPEI